MSERLPDTIDWSLNENRVLAGKEYLKLGYRPIPLHLGTKHAAVKWKKFQTESPTAGDLEKWFNSGGSNVALLTGNGIVVVDIDDPALLEAVIAHCGDTPMRCQTPSGGVHLYYAMRKGVHYGNAVKIRGKPLDLRCEGGYVVCPWSRSDEGVPYRWLGDVVPAKELPLLKVSWLRQRKRIVTQAEVRGNLDDMQRRARAYVSRMEGAMSGQGGHNKTFRVACVLVTKFGLDFDSAWPILVEYNRQCEPEWTIAELRHKLFDALKTKK